MKVVEELFTTVHVEPQNPCSFVIAFPFDFVLKATVMATAVLNGLNLILVFVFIACSYDRTNRLRILAW